MIEPSAERRLAYLDSSALVKLVVEEPESAALEVRLGELTLATSVVARVEVVRAARLANPATVATAQALIDSCLLVAASDAILRSAAQLASGTLRTLDAIHLASALRVDPDELVAYDRRLVAAAREQGLTVTSPGRDL